MRRLMAASAVAALALGIVAPMAVAASKDAHGWWWRPQTGLLGAAIPPPGVPEDGLAVEATPDGPNAIAAVRYVLDKDETRPALVLNVADQHGEIAIQACAATEVWSNTQAGAWDRRPTYDCGSAVDGTPSEDGTTWRWELDTLLRKQRLNVVLVPAPGGGRVTFEAPDDASLQTQRGEAGSQSFDPPPVSDFTPPESSSGGSSSDDFPASADGSSGGVDPGFAPAGSSGSAPTSTPAAQAPAAAPPGSTEAPLAAGPLQSEAPVAMAPASSDSSRKIGAFIAALAAVLALGLWRQDRWNSRLAATPGSGGSAAGQHVGGLGRFTRPRVGSPRRLV